MESIGDYQVLGELGRGGVGAVYRCRDGAGREVALKTLHQGREATPSQLKRFQREAKALSELVHPHVVRLLDLGQHQGLPFLVMELHPGGSLEDMLQRSPLPIPDAVQLGDQLASALEAAHERGLLHRDLKPGNVLLAGDGRAMLTDFGLTKDLRREGQTERLTQSGTFLGSPGYWAPEQAAGRQDLIGPATDVYGLGAILYAALSGRPPIVAGGLIECLQATARERPPSLQALRPEVPPGLDAVVQRCLEKEVGERYASAAELRAALASSLLEGEGRRTRGRAPALLALTTLLLAAGLVAWALAPWGLAPWRLAAKEPDSAGAATPSPSASLASQTEPSLSEAAAFFARASELLETKDYLAAAPLLERAAERGHAGAAHALGAFHQEGRGLKRDLPLAAQWYRRAAKGGHAEAAYALARLKQKERQGLEQDLPGARALFLQAAQAGHAPSMTELGTLLRLGRGGPKDEAGALEWWRRASAAGNPRGTLRLGMAYEEGLGVEADPAEAFRLYRLAAEADDPVGMFKLAWFFQQGIACDQSWAKAVEWCRRAAEAGQGDAMGHYASFLEFGVEGLAPDPAAACEWYRRAAQKGIPSGSFGLGRCYLKGRGVEVDLERSTQLFAEAAKRNHGAGMVAFGSALAEGRGLPRADPAEAARWYRRASELGNANGSYSLAKLIHRGAAEGGLAEAEALYRRALSQDEKHPESLHDLAGILMQRGEAHYVEATGLLQRSAKLGYLPAVYNLGVAYLRGLGVPPDDAAARRCFEFVAQRSTDPAQKASARRILEQLAR